MNDEFKKKLDHVLLALGLSLMIGILILGQEFRDSVGQSITVIMNPVVSMFGESNFHIVLFILASFTALYATLIQKYMIDWELMRNTQQKMKLFQKEFREAQLSNNTALLNKMEGERSKMMHDQLEMSKQQFKPMIYISIISLPLFMWAYFYIQTHEAASFVFPFWGQQLLIDPIWGPFQYWIFWYFIASLAISQLIRKALDVGGV